MAEALKRQPFTVFGIYEDNQQLWVEWVYACTTRDALIQGAKAIHRRDAYASDDSGLVLGVIPGHVKEIGGLDSPLRVADVRTEALEYPLVRKRKVTA